jgi:hypothetical protein
MKTLSIRIVTAILVSLVVSSVHAQSPATSAVQKKGTASVKTKRRIPPAPAIPMGRSKYSKTANKPHLLGDPDPSGRADLAGKPVPFYPISKGSTAKQNSVSPIRVGKRPSTSGPAPTPGAPK